MEYNILILKMKKILFFISSLLALAGSVQAASILFDYQASPGTSSALYNPSVADGVSITGQTVTNAS